MKGLACRRREAAWGSRARRGSLVCERLAAGRITAVDRSPKMIVRARERNAAYADKARFIQASNEEADLGEERFDRAFALHVAALHRPGPALAKAREHLVEGGVLGLFSQAPSWRSAGPAEEFAAATSQRTETNALASAFAAAVIARRAA